MEQPRDSQPSLLPTALPQGLMCLDNQNAFLSPNTTVGHGAEFGTALMLARVEFVFLNPQAV